jgi:hypothetical protein
MPPFGPRPPLEILLVEPIYFLIILVISGYIYYKTKEIYELTKHRGIFHFRNIFLYFGLAHFFRLGTLIFIFASDYARPHPLIPLISLMAVSYFSTMAIFSVILSITAKKIHEEKIPYGLLQLCAFVVLAFVFVTRSHLLLTLVQAGMFIFALMLMLKESRDSKGFSQNKMTYALLFLFWTVSTLAFTRRLFPWEAKIPLYVISAAVYFSVMHRVRKRLVDGKKG